MAKMSKREKELGALVGELTTLETAIETNLEDTTLQKQLIELINNSFLTKIDDWNEAEATWDKLILALPNGKHTRRCYTHLLSKQGSRAERETDYKKMFALYEKALKIDPTASMPHKELGTYYQEREQWQNAIRHLEQAVANARYVIDISGQSASLGDYRAELRDRLGSCYFKSGNFSAAVDCWTEALKEKEWSDHEREQIEADITKAKKAMPKWWSRLWSRHK